MDKREELLERLKIGKKGSPSYIDNPNFLEEELLRREIEEAKKRKTQATVEDEEIDK